MNTINKYIKTDKEIDNLMNEIGLVIIDNCGRLLVENKGKYIDIPRVTLSNENKESILKSKYNRIFGKDPQYFYELYRSINYRYDTISSEKAKIEYNYVITNDLPKENKYRFLTLKHLKSLLCSLDYNVNINYVKEELEELISKLQELYNGSIILSEFNNTDYLEQVTDSFITDDKDNNSIKQYPFFDSYIIIEDTLNFIRDIKKFSIENNKDYLRFQIENTYPIKSFVNNEWYSDIIVQLSHNGLEYLLSIYLLNSYFSKDIKIYFDDNEYDIDEYGKVVGLPQLIIYSENLNMMDKVENFEKIRKLDYRNNYLKRYF